ncbi:MAG: MFS transporter [Betaproteobacteria bacterium]|nr:MFS transporter [Betaproteobacteria bacterium]
MTIYIVLLIVLFNMTSFRGSKILVSLFAIELGAPPFYIGALVATYSVFPMLLALYAGKLSDRLGVRLPMLAGSMGLAVGLSLPYLSPTLAALFASAALIGASHVFYNVSVQNLVGTLGGPDDRTRNFTNYGLVMAVGSFIGPLVAGFSIDRFGHAASYLYLAAVPLVPAAIVLAARGIGGRAAISAADEAHPVNAQSLLANQPLRRTLFTSAAILTGIDLFQFYMPIYGHSIGLSASTIGVVISMFAAAAFVVRLVMPAMVRRWSAEVVLIWSLFAGALAYLMFPLFQSAVLLSVMAFALGLGMGCGQPLTLTLIYSRAPQGRSGEALGLRMTINNFMHIAVPLLFGSLGSLMGVAPVFVANALILASGGALVRKGERAARG